MTAEHCPEYEAQLVELADGELPESEAQRVRAHVTQCDGCRALLSCLDGSLVLAQRVWNEEEVSSSSVSLSEPVSNQGAAARKTDRNAVGIIVLALVATVLLVVVPRLPLFQEQAAEPARKTVAAVSDSKVEVKRQAAQEQDRAEAESIERLLQQREQAARLNAVVQILGTLPELSDVQQQTEAYLQERYQQ